MTLFREYKLYDDFKKPYDFRYGLPYSGEIGTPYKLLTNYQKKDKIFTGYYRLKGKTEREKQKYKIKKFCKGYFYINSSDEKDLKFHLTEIEIKKKFGNIEYIKTIDFLNKYGYGSNNQENITDIIIWNFLLAMFFIFSTYILFLFAI